MAVLGYSGKLKRGLALSFGAHFLYDFSIKMFLIKFSINGQRHTLFLSQYIKQNVLLSSCLDS